MATPDKLLCEAIRYYRLPLFELLHQAHECHRANNDPANIQKCSLLSIKTGGCPEDCAYCPQSAHYKTGVKHQPLVSVNEVREAARKAKKEGADRLCMGAAWRGLREGKDFETVLDIIRAVKEEGIEACATLGMLSFEQARLLKEAGLDVYNHNLDTSRDYYSKITRTRTYEDRIRTLGIIREAGMKICSGGIIGMGESPKDRCAMLAELASMDPQPESVPINILVPVKGTPLQDAAPVDSIELVRMIAVARLLMPKTRVKLSAGRSGLSKEAQILALFAGANSIFICEQLLTTPNSRPSEDYRLLESLSSLPETSL